MFYSTLNQAKNIPVVLSCLPNSNLRQIGQGVHYYQTSKLPNRDFTFIYIYVDMKKPLLSPVPWFFRVPQSVKEVLSCDTNNDYYFIYINLHKFQNSLNWSELVVEKTSTKFNVKISYTLLMVWNNVKNVCQSKYFILLQ